MAKRKYFSVHDLYPEDYRFDWDAFEADPEHYQFTAEDIAYSNAMELEEYEMKTPMTPYEKRALRRWVASGHSVRDMPPSKYPCIHCCYPPPSFLDVYREDKMLDAAMKGMTDEEKTAYLKEYIGFVDETDEELVRREENKRLHEQTPEAARTVIRTLQRKIFYLYMFLAEQGFTTEPDEYLDEHMDDPAPFEEDW